jgi:2-keto-4-pentenoate hydratase/2-oxohepta-3-ene-1,7-dioic acid hydratase in catechol pathway
MMITSRCFNDAISVSILRLVHFRWKDRVCTGVTDGFVVQNLTAADSGFDSIAAALGSLDLIERFHAKDVGIHHSIGELDLLPPVSDSTKIFCVGLNYRSHAEEVGLPIPSKPAIFVRFPDSFAGHRQSIIRPTVSSQFDFEGELGVVIGKAGRHISEADALRYVGGYTCVAENSIRDYQRHSNQAIPGKNFPASGALGPWITTSDEIPDPSKLLLRTTLNGAVVQEARNDDMIFSVQEIIAYLSSWTPLRPGDVIAMGTPAGVGLTRSPPLWLQQYDTLKIEIEDVGVLENTVRDEPNLTPVAPTARLTAS